MMSSAAAAALPGDFGATVQMMSFCPESVAPAAVLRELPAVVWSFAKRKLPVCALAPQRKLRSIRASRSPSLPSKVSVILVAAVSVW